MNDRERRIEVLEFLKSVVLTLSSPLSVMSILFIFVLFLSYTTRSKITKKINFVAILAFLCLSQPWIANLVLYPLEFAEFDSDSFDSLRPTVIFVPACYYDSKSRITEISKWHECSLQRLVQAKVLSDRHGIPIVVTGANFLHDKNVFFASKAKELLERIGVNSNLVFEIPLGVDTYSEVLAFSSLYKEHKVIAVTSATHRIRLCSILSDLNVTATIVSVDYQSSGEVRPFLSMPSAIALEGIRKAIYEYLALIKYYIAKNAFNKPNENFARLKSGN